MNSLSDFEIQEGWQLLFDGKTTAGWHGFNKGTVGAGWQVLEHTLHFDGSPKDDSDKGICNDLATDRIFSDFHLKLEWKISVKGNSGIMFLVQEDAKYNTPWVTGPEMQVLDNAGYPESQLEKHRAGDLYDLIACSKDVSKPAGEWNKVEIILYRNNLKFIFNEVEVLSTILWDEKWNQLVAGSKFKDMPEFAKSKTGRIALQDHGSAVWYRNMMVKEFH